MGLHRLNFIGHSRIKRLFTPDPSGELPFREVTIHGGIARLESRGPGLSDRQLGVITLRAMGIKEGTIIKIYNAAEKGINTRLGGNQNSSARKKLCVNNHAQLFPVLVAREILTIATPSPRAALSSLAEEDIRLVELVACYGSKEIAEQLGQAKSTINNRVSDMGLAAGISGRIQLVAAAVMEEVIDPQKLFPATVETGSPT